MKLLNQSLKFITLPILVIINLWAVILYLNLLDEIKDSIDDGLYNYKILIKQKIRSSNSNPIRHPYNETNYEIKENYYPRGKLDDDIYADTSIYMIDEHQMEPARVLSTTFNYRGHSYNLRIFSPTAEEDDLAEDLFWSVLWLYLCVVAIIFIVNNVVIRKLWKPFYHLLEQIDDFKLGKHEYIPKITTNTKEFIDLQTSITTLLLQSKTSYTRQKEFIGNIAHELQTPLAIIIARLELLMEQGDFKPDQADKLTDVLHIIERLVRLNKALLLLTKIDNKHFIDNQHISLNDVLTHTINDLCDFANFRHIDVQLKENEPHNVYISPELANIIVTNLLKNALFHNIDHGKITIHLSQGKLRICNTGSDLSLDKELIFLRFIGSKSKGSGLGLAIVKAICRLYSFHIDYHFINKMHCFEIQLFPD